MAAIEASHRGRSVGAVGRGRLFSGDSADGAGIVAGAVSADGAAGTTGGSASAMGMG